MMKLHGYWRSSASYRVRIALVMKGVEVEHIAVNLRDGEQGGSDHKSRNPQGFVPVLELEDGTLLTQSLAILDYLDTTFPEPELMPRNAILRSKILSASLTIACDVSPIQNLSVLKYLRAELEQDDTGVGEWVQHWITRGFTALEHIASQSGTTYLLSDQPMLFECCLVPQVYNARRFGVDMGRFPKLKSIDALCRELPAFQCAAPENQQDAF